MRAKQIPISIAARLIYHLGEQLISDELVALLELIKNSYDADATRCMVKVDSTAETPYGLGLITIADNGNGMLPHTVENDFLRLATDYKKVNKVSPHYKRRTLGEKGLGRLSYQRLGRFVQVRTVPRIERLRQIMSPDDERAIMVEGVNCIDITMDWDGFSDSDDISSVYATVEEKHIGNVKCGTLITIQGIRNSNFWKLSVEKRRRLQDEILALINPFAESKNNAAFNLELDVNGEKFLIDSIDESVVDQLSDVSCHFSFDGCWLTLEAEFKEKYVTRQKERYLKESKDKGFSVICDTFETSAKYHQSFKVNLSDENTWETRCQLAKHSVSLIDGRPAIDFVFDGSMYVVDKLSANRTDIDKNIIEESLFVQKNFRRIGDLWNRIAGVYMYRDQFRILPYGKDDWLGLTQRSQKGKATILKQGNVSGYVHLNGEKSESIREQTNRQGILEDEYGSNFLTILDKIIVEQLFEWDKAVRSSFTAPKLDSDDKIFWNANKTIGFQYYEAVEQKYETIDAKLESTLQKAKKVSTEASLSLFDAEDLKKEVYQLATDVSAFKKVSSDLQKDYQQKLSLTEGKLSEYTEIIPLLGQTLIIETATHELNRIYSNLAQYTSDLSKCSNAFAESIPQLAQIVLLFRKEIAGLDMQLNHIMPTQRYKLKDVQDIDMASFFAKQYVEESAVTKRLEKAHIKCLILGSSFTVKASIGNLIVIFDNLVMNAEYWLDKNDVTKKEIYFECAFGNIVRVWDSGLGISKEIENTLFEPFHTMKRDGRGLGLYIVQELLSLMGSTIKLLDERNSYGNRYKFEIAFQER